MHRAGCRAPMKAAHGKGHTLKHARRHVKHHHKGVKHHPRHHHATATKHAHHVHAKAKHATHARAKGLALTPGDVACCTIEPLASSLRLQGLTITGADILRLFRLAGGDNERGMPIAVALEATSEFGLGGFRLAGFAEEVLDHPSLPFGKRLRLWQDVDLSEGNHLIGESPLHGTSLILGLDLPGQHAVLATADGWWSWGQLWCPCEFPDAVIDEAWRIEWAVAA